MPDGDCPLGRENQTNIEEHERRLTQMAKRQNSLEANQQELSVNNAVQNWKIGAIIGAINMIGIPIVLVLLENMI